MWIVLALLAFPLNGPNLFNAHASHPFSCLRDVLVTNTTSGAVTTCGDLVASHARLSAPKLDCYTWFGLLTDLKIEAQHQTVSPGANPRAYELQHAVRTHCRPCCEDVYPWAVKTDM
jgi:hypothetical protein